MTGRDAEGWNLGRIEYEAGTPTSRTLIYSQPIVVYTHTHTESKPGREPLFSFVFAKVNGVLYVQRVA